MFNVNVNIPVKETYEVICDLAPKVKRGLANTFAVLKGVITEQQAKIFGRVTGRVQEILDAAGVQPEEIRYCPLMLGALWTERASLEENPTLQELWARLMANALDPNFKEEVRVAFIDIIKSLSPLDVRIMEFMWPQKLFPLPTARSDRFQISEALGADWNDIEVGLDNLKRLSLIADPNTLDAMPIVGKGSPRFTALGYAFLRACVVKN